MTAVNKRRANERPDEEPKYDEGGILAALTDTSLTPDIILSTLTFLSSGSNFNEIGSDSNVFGWLVEELGSGSEPDVFWS